ncbi:MAG TPA: hypothetical protein VGQ91_09010, partial [Ideonella sp.]|nr:hypothetical protein [Ideonella sp.]
EPIYKLFAVRYDSHLGTWGEISELAAAASASEAPATAVSAQGEVMLLWLRDVGSSIRNPYWTMLSGR